MTYSKDHKMISIEMKPLFGKKPELYIGDSNSAVKVACFRNEKAARDFEEMLIFFFGKQLVTKAEGDGIDD